MKLQNRTILITGGTSGIGLELARQLIARGNEVIVTGRDPARLDSTKAALPAVHVLRSDVSQPAEIEALHAEVTARFPALDLLVNNAGIMRNLDLLQPRGLDDVVREIDINLSGPVRMVQAFLPHLRTRPGAAIVNVSSGLAFVPFPLSPVYSATKAAIHAYSRALRIQLEGTGVTLIELAPPGVETPLFRDDFPELGKMKAMDVTELATRAIAGIEAGQLEIRPGQSNILKLFSRLAPGFILNQLARPLRAKRVRA